MATLAERDWDESRTWRWLILALVCSLFLHVLAGIWFGWIRLDQMAVPANEARILQPFQLKRVDINPTTLMGNLASPASAVPMARTPEPAPRLSSDGREVERALQSTRPQMLVPDPPDPRHLNRDANSTASPYTFSEQAALTAEMARFEVGPLTSVEGTPSFATPTFDPSGSGSIPGPGGAAGTRGAPAAGGDAPPSFEDLVAGFRTPTPGLNPNLPEPVLLRLPSDVLFDFDSDQLRPEAFPLLNQAADLIRGYATARIRVDGHTDTIGTEEYNLELSRRRAEAAERWLRQALPEGKYTIESRGFGKTKPLVNPEGTADQQRANRRVEIVIQALNP